MSTRKAAPKKRVLVIQPECLDDLRYWMGANTNTAEKILRMMEEALKTPFAGIGKPEPLKHIGADVWSRRITGTDRLVYRVFDDRIDCLMARYHYGK